MSSVYGTGAISAENAVTTTKPAAANTFNFQDQFILPFLFVFCLVLATLYVIYRTCVLIILRHHFKGARGGFRFKILISLFPCTFAILLMVRSVNHYLNNLCVVWVPIAYFIRTTIYASTVAYLSLALIPVLSRQMKVQAGTKARVRQTILPIAIHLILAGPGYVFVVVMAAARLGVAMNGVCTLSSPGSVLDVPVAVWIETFTEASVLAVNMVATVRLHLSSIPGRYRADIRNVVFWGSFLLMWDILTRFGIWTRLADVALPGAFLGDFKKVLMIGFPTIYVAGMSAFIAHSLEYRLAWAVRLVPFSPRFPLLVLGLRPLGERESARIIKVYTADRATRSVPLARYVWRRFVHKRKGYTTITEL